MKLGKFLIPLALLIAAAVWLFLSRGKNAEFKVSARRIVPRVEPSLAVGLHFAVMVAADGSLWLWGHGKESGVTLGGQHGWRPL